MTPLFLFSDCGRAIFYPAISIVFAPPSQAAATACHEARSLLLGLRHIFRVRL